MKKLFLLLAVLTPLLGQAKKTTPTHVRWCSFNVRLNTKKDIPIGASWESRRDRVCQYLRDNKLDVVGFQEVTTSMLPEMAERLPEYAYVAQGRRGTPTGDEMTPVFYLKEKYDELAHGTFWYSEHPDSVGSKCWDTPIPRIATWVKLRDKQTKRVFIALSTHFPLSSNLARTESGKLLVAKTAKIAGKNPAMLGGDFNMSENHPGYAAIVGNPYVLRDAYYMSPHHTGVRYTYQQFSKIAPWEAPRGDFMFVSEQIQVTRTHFEKDIPDEPLSDHNPIWADLEF